MCCKLDDGNIVNGQQLTAYLHSLQQIFIPLNRLVVHNPQRMHKGYSSQMFVSVCVCPLLARVR